MNANSFRSDVMRAKPASQSQLRAGVGLALLVVTLGGQLLWVLTTH